MAVPPTYGTITTLDFKQIELNGSKLYTLWGALPDLKSTLQKIEGQKVELEQWSRCTNTLQAQIINDKYIVCNTLDACGSIAFVVAFIGSLVLGTSFGLPGLVIALGTAALILGLAYLAVQSKLERAHALQEIIAAANRQIAPLKRK